MIRIVPSRIFLFFILFLCVGGRGLEPPLLAEHGPKPCASAISPPARRAFALVVTSSGLLAVLATPARLPAQPPPRTSAVHLCAHKGSNLGPYP